MASTPKLPLTSEEKAKLRKAKVKIADLHKLTIAQIIQLLEIPEDRAQHIKGLAEFQSVPSIGGELASKLVNHLHLFSLQELKEKDGATLFNLLEKELGVWTDSCVEDQLRCVIHFANHPSSDKQWFDFTEERKQYREVYGYPKDRPTKAWYE
ncbi:helix-hairpin-helix domain-containing protein [Bacillus sinesaloumensis]|uniref:helix-hairpin-helix domain-containing protein n=1 Tax=Litchfieldia sinesaloumensis TaxID=1926280 RepID=UPI00098851A7|nr:helix-hairpin-helix domain-containing protein [Bacillus sinesaloumensis]